MFITEVENPSIYNLNKFLQVSNYCCLNVHTSSANLEYSLNINFKEWGIKSIDFELQSCRFNIFWDIELEDLSEVHKQQLLAAGGVLKENTIEGKIEITNADFTIKNNCHYSENGCFLIDDLEIDLEKKEIQLSNNF